MYSHSNLHAHKVHMWVWSKNEGYTRAAKWAIEEFADISELLQLLSSAKMAWLFTSFCWPLPLHLLDLLFFTQLCLVLSFCFLGAGTHWLHPACVPERETMSDDTALGTFVSVAEACIPI